MSRNKVEYRTPPINKALEKAAAVVLDINKFSICKATKQFAVSKTILF